MKVLLFIPTLGEIPTQMAAKLMHIKTNHQLQLVTTSRTIIHNARNSALEKCIELDCDYLIMLDDDNPPISAVFIDELISHNKDIVSGVIRLRNNEEFLNIAYSENINGLIKYHNYKNLNGIKDRLFPIDNCGSGLVCIKRNVVQRMLEKYPRPFENKYSYYINKNDGTSVEFSPDIFGDSNFATNKDGGLIIQGRELSEDYLFFERAKSLGFELFADKEMQCIHFGQQKTLYV